MFTSEEIPLLQPCRVDKPVVLTTPGQSESTSVDEVLSDIYYGQIKSAHGGQMHRLFQHNNSNQVFPFPGCLIQECNTETSTNHECFV